MQPKSIYLAMRRPGFPREAFIERWQQHARLAMSLPFWPSVARYAQNDPIALPGLDAACDAIGTTWYTSMAERERVAGMPELFTPMLADELVFLSGYVREHAMLAEEEILKPGPAGGWKLLVFDEAGEPTLDLADAAGVTRAVVSRRIAEHLTPLSRLPFRSLLECWFEDRGALEAAVRRNEAVLRAPSRLATGAFERPMFGW
jgi:hypothetical protein